MEATVLRRVMIRLPLFLYGAGCLGLLCFVSWSLLTPDPFAVVRQTSLAWLEQISDLLVHAAVFTLLSSAWLGFWRLTTGELSAFALFIMLGYCVSMEALQAFVPGRHCDPIDGVANVAGFVFGLTLLRLAGQLRMSRRSLTAAS